MNIEMPKTADFAKINFDKLITETTRIYSGLDHHCRCGCGGKYHEKTDKSFKGMLTRVKNAVANGKIIELENEGSYLNLSMENNKCYCLYFED